MLLRIIFIVSILSGSVEAFTARLQRPWEKPRSFLRQNSRQPLPVLFYTDPDRTQSSNGDTQDVPQQGRNEKQIDDLALSLRRTLHYTNYNMTKLSAGGIPAVAVPKAEPVEVVQIARDESEDHIMDYTKELFSMTRPKNLPGVVLFHIMGSCLAYRQFEAATAGPVTTSFLQLLATPSMLITLVALLLVSSTSMLVNDYYDYKLGNDSLKPDKAVQKVPLAVVKKALSYLYAISLFCAAMVPGVPGRVAVISGLILTYLYTKHVKPKTWAKNALCASLIALSPFTSGVAAMSVLSPVSTNLLFEHINWPLVRLVSLLFVGIMGREIVMDIADTEDDSAHSVRTVSVVYGRTYASHIAWISSLMVLTLAVSGPVLDSIDAFVVVRRATFAGVGSLLQMRRYWTVAETEGRDARAIKVAVDEGLLSMVLLLASFI
ncbi:UbiA prenyltransferase family protein [Nitzschia inconspicua]|uniref:UbiA prenyltransferase family protein n=1 Tax=Nitzschia inconspicua TaxID=303405 RepID=A0A9K3PLQ6_9STRA|nr:UbiA prenyltransferase family protein [Nitzschia inconspicua]